MLGAADSPACTSTYLASFKEGICTTCASPVPRPAAGEATLVSAPRSLGTAKFVDVIHISEHWGTSYLESPASDLRGRGILI